MAEDDNHSVPLEGEIIRPGERGRERIDMRVLQIGWPGKLALAVAGLALLAVVLVLSFWIFLFLAPFGLGLMLWTWIKKRN